MGTPEAWSTPQLDLGEVSGAFSGLQWVLGRLCPGQLPRTYRWRARPTGWAPYLHWAHSVVPAPGMYPSGSAGVTGLQSPGLLWDGIPNLPSTSVWKEKNQTLVKEKWELGPLRWFRDSWRGGARDTCQGPRRRRECDQNASFPSDVWFRADTSVLISVSIGSPQVCGLRVFLPLFVAWGRCLSGVEWSSCLQSLRSASHEAVKERYGIF